VEVVGVRIIGRRRGWPGPAEGKLPAEVPVAVFSGGLLSYSGGGLWGMPVTTTDGLVRLEFFSWGIRVRGKVLVRRLLPAWEARFEEISSARPLSAPLGRQGVYFAARNVPGRVVFWTRRGHEILALLENQAVRADFSEVRIRQLYEMEELPK
jgi:hypothetical protein